MRCFNKKCVICVVLILAILTIVIYYFNHSTYYKYNDSLIIGNNISEIKKIYGEYDLVSGVYVAYYIYTDNKGFLPDHLKHYYYMYYDNNGVVYQVEDACQPGG